MHFPKDSDIPAVFSGGKCIGIYRLNQDHKAFGIVTYDLDETDVEEQAKGRIVLAIRGINDAAMHLLDNRDASVIMSKAQVMMVMAVNNSDSLIPAYFAQVRTSLINLLNTNISNPMN